MGITIKYVSGLGDQGNLCVKCGHFHRGGRPNGGTICDVQIRHAGADADQDAYCKCPAPVLDNAKSARRSRDA